MYRGPTKTRRTKGQVEQLKLICCPELRSGMGPETSKERRVLLTMIRRAGV